MCKINVKKSILEIVEKNNLEILKIDLVNSDEAFARRYNEDRNIFSCKVYITLEDFEVDSVFWHDDVLGTVKILKNLYGQNLVAMKEVLGGKSIEFQTFIKINLKSQRMIQKQTWKDEIRILITDEENLSSVQIFIPLYVSDIFGKADALIYALFVDNNYRRKGVAKSLLQLAEQQAKLNGVKTIGLHFVEEESDRFVLDWYLRSGYKLFDKKSNLLIKKLEEQLWYVLIVSVRNLYLKQSLTKLYIAEETIMVLANAQKYHKVALRNSYEIKTVYVGHRVYKIVNGFSIRVNITIKK